jgi:hypothetical protein
VLIAKTNVIEEINSCIIDGKLYVNKVKRYSNRTSKNMMVIKGEQGELITEKEEILKRWKDFFTNLLNIP